MKYQLSKSLINWSEKKKLQPVY